MRHGEVEFLSDAHLAEVRGDLEPRFEGADAVPCHCVRAREGVHGGRCFGGCVLEESLVPALVFQVGERALQSFHRETFTSGLGETHCQDLQLLVSEAADPVSRGPHVSVARAALAVFPLMMGGGVARIAARA